MKMHILYKVIDIEEVHKNYEVWYICLTYLSYVHICRMRIKYYNLHSALYKMIALMQVKMQIITLDVSTYYIYIKMPRKSRTILRLWNTTM